jgi:MFS family permease
VASLSGLGLATANNLALCRLTLIPKPAVGIVTGIQQVAVSLAGMVAPILSGWLLHASGGYEVPMYRDLRLPAARRGDDPVRPAPRMGSEGARRRQQI